MSRFDLAKNIARFWSHTAPPDERGCRLWTAFIRDDGYGWGQVDGTVDMVHRHAWRLTYGPIPAGLYVLHKCDNRACVEPTHLFLGSHDDNMADMRAKGRSRGAPKGSLNHNARLTEDQVREIRTRYTHDGRGARALASEYGISTQGIRRIVARLSWKHVS